MELETQQAPPVVAVVVVHEPGEWFDESIDALADQDYPNLRFLFLVSDADDDLQTRIKTRMPKAFVRTVNADLGFGAAANEVLQLVEGDSGFFLFCHDDVAPEPDAVRLLVEEIYRSNAGIVGPKIVEWNDPRVLQTVGLGVDRFGEFDVGVEVGEKDQEQHDGVRDVFALPSAFLLARADLFREIGGFDPSISFYGDDVDLCWRLHHLGARVIVVPAARVRHRSQLAKRRPDMRHDLLQATHRMRTVATLTGRARLPGRILELVLLTLAEFVGGIFTGRIRGAWASLRALVGLIPRSLSLLARRRAIKPLRRVPEREVLGLQIRGSARFTGFLRTRETTTFVGGDSGIRQWKDRTTAPVLAWIGVLAAVLIGSRQFIANGIPAVGEFLSMPASPRVLLSSYISAWNGNGFGATSANPTGWATLSGLSVFTLFRMGALHTWFIIGLVILGLIGVWKLATVFPSVRARIVALVVYAASPLVVGAMSTGRLTVLIAFASTPWIVHAIRRAVGIETADPRSAEIDLPDGVASLSGLERIRRTAGAAVVIGLAAAFVPAMVFLALAISVVLGAATLLALAPWRTALLHFGVGIAASIGGLLLNFPWFSSWSWEQLVGPPPIGDRGTGLADLASFQIGIADFAYLSLALYLSVIAAIVLGRAWRLTWAVRSGLMVVVFGAVAILADSGSLPFNGPEAGVLLAPVAVGLAISSAATLAAFDLDVRGGSFGWRQPLGLLASVGVVIGVFPGVAALGDGAWNTPKTPLSVLIEAQLPDDAEDRVLKESNENGPLIDPGVGGYNVLLLGDARLLPVPAVEYRDGVSYAVIGDTPLDIRDRWAAPDSDAADAVEMALDQMASSSTLRAGRLLAPLGVRFIVVPEFDNVESTTADPLPLPGGLISALEDQLDLTSVTGLPTLEVFANTAWMPVISQLTGSTAEASASAGAGALVRANLSSASPVFLGADETASSSDEVVPGVIHLAVPFDENWSLTVEGESIEPRRAFGVTTAFDVERKGIAVLEYSSPSMRLPLLFVQVALWLAMLFAATRVSIPLARRRGALPADETLIDFDDFTGAVAWRVLDPGLDITGQMVRAEALPIDDGGSEVDKVSDNEADLISKEHELIDAEQVDADPIEGMADESDGELNEGDR